MYQTSITSILVRIDLILSSAFQLDWCSQYLFDG